MTGMELGNCARHYGCEIVIVSNNASREMRRAFMPDAGFNDLGQWKFAALVDASGGQGTPATSCKQFAAALSDAHGRRGDTDGFQASSRGPHDAVAATTRVPLMRFFAHIKEITPRDVHDECRRVDSRRR